MPADDGIEKSAILLIALGEDYASEVLKHLGGDAVTVAGVMRAAGPMPPTQSMLPRFPHLTAWSQTWQKPIRLTGS